MQNFELISRFPNLISYTQFHQILFVLTGVFSTCGNQFVYYQGAADKGTLFPVLAIYIGMVPVSYITLREEGNNIENSQGGGFNKKKIYYKNAFIISLFDFIANVFCIIGLVYAGSGIYQVIYSAVTVFSALLRRIFLKYSLSKQQWIAIFIATFGISMSTIGQSSTPEAFNVMIGILFTLLGTLFMSLVYVLNEYFMTRALNPPSPRELCSTIGSFGTLFCMTYIILYPLRNFDEMVVKNVVAHNGNIIVILSCYFLLVLSSFLHSWSFYYLMRSEGAVSTGILQPLRAVIVFFTSAIFYCDHQESQCYTKLKLFQLV